MQKYIFSFLFLSSCFLVRAQKAPEFAQQKLDTITVASFGNHWISGKLYKKLKLIKLSPEQAAEIESLDDLLNLIAGVDIRVRGSKGVQSDLSIRGGNFDQVLILLNGVKVNNPQTGHHSLDLPVDVSMIDHIEILEGASGQHFGVNAYSGVINIITKNPEKEQAHSALKIGQYGYLKTDFDLAHTSGKIAVYNGFTYQRSTGYLTKDSINNTDFYSIKDFVHLRYNDAKHPVDLQAGYHQKDFGANSFYTSKYPWQFEKTHGYFASLSTHFGKKVTWQPVLFYKLHYDEFQLFRESVYTYKNGYFIHEKDTAQYAPHVYYPGHNYHKTQQIGGQLQGRFLSKFGNTYLNVALRNEHIWSNKLGKALSKPILINDRVVYTKSDERTYIETQLNQSKKWARLEAGFGFNLLYEKHYQWQINGGGYVSYRHRSWIHYINVSTASRLPTFTDLYYQGPANIGNPDLQPEQAVTYEAGTKFLNGQNNIGFNIFVRQSQNTIDWIKFHPADKWQPQNLTGLQTFGVEFNATHRFKKSVFKEVRLSYAYLNMTKDQNQSFISKYALDYLKHKANLLVSHHFFFDSEMTWTAVYKNRNGQYLDYTNGQYRLFDYKPYWIANMKWTKKINKTGVGISIENIFNTTYNDLSYIKMPGRWLIFEIDYRIK